MLEKLLAGEVLKIGIVDLALAHAFVRQPVNLFEQQQPRSRTVIPPIRASKRQPAGSRPAGFFATSGTFARFVVCDGSGGTGKPAVAYEGRTESCPGGFLMP
jgi:hypothetical protein